PRGDRAAPLGRCAHVCLAQRGSARGLCQPPRSNRRDGEAAGMTLPRMGELAAALLILGAGVYFYRRKDTGNPFGNQGAVILIAVAVIMGIHALGGLDYRPSQAEADYFRSRAQ